MKRLLYIFIALSAIAQAQTTWDGITIPAGHPAWYWTAPRIATAQAWVTATGYPGELTTAFRAVDYEDEGFTCLVMANSTACNNLVTWATGLAAPTCTTAGVDPLRWYGQGVYDAYDWAYSSFSAAQLSALESRWGSCLTAQDHHTAPGWGTFGAGGTYNMPESNYFWGYFRDDVEAAAATMSDNPTNAKVHLDDGLGASGGAYNSSHWNNLLNLDVGSSTQIDQQGVDIKSLGYAFPGAEGFGEYGRYMLAYDAQPLIALGLMGRREENEDTMPYAGVYMTIYNTVFGSAYRGATEYFTWSDDEDYQNESGTCVSIGHNGYANGSLWTNASTGGCGMRSQYFGDWMQAAVNEFPTANAGKYARKWLDTVQPNVSPIFASLDAAPTALALSGLPLDYGTTEGYLWSRDSWADLSGGQATQVLFQGNNSEPGAGHKHQDYGTFQVYKKGIPIIRETVDYATNVAGYGSVGLCPINEGCTHNVGLVNGVGASPVSFGAVNRGTVLRQEVQTGYSFQATNLAAIYNTGGHPNVEVSTYVREFYFFRGIPALIIFDRWTTANVADSTTFLTHCLTNPTDNAGGTYTTDDCIVSGQEALYTHLIPAHPSTTIVTESANSATCANCQFRIESNNSAPGNVLSYQLVAIQLCDSGACALTPSMVDSAPGTPGSGTFTVTLDANNSLVVNKAATSSGGTIKAAGVTTSLAAGIEAMTVGATGPVWSGSASTAATPSCTPGAGNFNTSQSVTCTDASAGAVMCYTITGATPVTNGTSGCTTGTLYSGAISVATTETLKVVAGGTGYTDSAVASYLYNIVANIQPWPAIFAQLGR